MQRDCSVSKIKKWRNATSRNGIDLMDEVSVNAYPNPSEGLFTIAIDADEPETYTVKVTDLQGREIWPEIKDIGEGEQQFEINITGKAKGVYLLLLGTGESSKTFRLIVQ